MERIRDGGVGSTSSAASRSASPGKALREYGELSPGCAVDVLRRAEEGPTIDYEDESPASPSTSSPLQSSSPHDYPLDSRVAPSDLLAWHSHNSHPSTTSSGYLRAAEDLMARIKSRVVSDTANSASGPDDRRRILSETDSQTADVTSANEGHEPAADRYATAESATSPRLRRSASSDPQQVVEEGSDGENRPPRIALNPPIAASPMAKQQVPKSAARAIRTIRPEEVKDVVPEQIGKMRYDKTTMRWVRERLSAPQPREESRIPSEESEDVFAGIDSEVATGPPVQQPDSPTQPAIGRPDLAHAQSAPAVLTPNAAGPSKPIRSAMRNPKYTWRWEAGRLGERSDTCAKRHEATEREFLRW